MSCARGCCESSLEHYRSVSISASACPSREGGRYAKRVNDTERQWHKDFDAVRQMKQDGIVPAKVDGAAEMLAKAETKSEIETGRLYTKAEKKVVAEAGIS